MRYADWKAVYIDNSKTLAEWEKSLANGGANGTIGEKTKDFSDTANPFGFRDIQGAHSRKDDLAAVNPNFSTKSPEWTQNCQRCVSAYEARRRGYDVEALPRILNGTDRLPYMHDKQNGWTSVYGSPVLISCSSSTGIKTGEKVKLEMTQFGDGARAIVRVQWQKKYGGGGHVFIAEQVNGKTIFIDPQTGNENVEFYFSMAKKTETYLLRIDTLDFTDNIKKCCHNRGGGAP